MNLLIITPFRNEEHTIEQTLQSICKQTVTPAKWILIDDNSTDASADIVKEYAQLHPFIKYQSREAKSGRSTGANIVNIFNYGLKVAADENLSWDIVLKLDADLVIEKNNYLAFIVDKFQKHPSLGIASGATYIESDGKRIIESNHKWHTQGPNKFYKKECLEAMGGLKPFKGWDGIDDILARSRGYITEKFFEQPILHMYPTQSRSAEGGIKKGLIREADGYQNRDYPLYMFLFKSISLIKKKGLYSSLFFLCYGIKIKFSKKPLVNKEESREVRRFLISRFLGRIKFS